ncbi:EexN family lipoprotein [Delftia lacustris]|uniref:EexN family lipoprotein n=1 Tax=Delftia lacustris TaxID=558537 RepID=UPI0035A73D7F
MMLGRLALMSCVALLSACDVPERPSPDTVESLMADSDHLKELREQCRLDRAKVGDDLCNKVARASRERFFGNPRVPYTPSEQQPKF